MQISARQGLPTCHITHWHGFGVFSITIQVLFVKIAGDKDKKNTSGQSWAINTAQIHKVYGCMYRATKCMDVCIHVQSVWMSVYTCTKCMDVCIHVQSVWMSVHMYKVYGCLYTCTKCVDVCIELQSVWMSV